MGLLHKLFGHIPDLQLTAEALVLAVGLAAGCAWGVAAAVGRTLRALHRADQPPADRTARRAVRVVRVVVFLGLTALFIPPFLELFGEPIRTGVRLKTLVEWLMRTGLQVVLIGTLAYGVHRAIVVMLHRFERDLAEAPSPDSVEYAKRARTLSSLIHNVATAVIVGAASLMMLQQLGVDTTPILTGAGILGLAVGFGAQTLVKDVISGFFLILENQIRVGDVAEINGQGGQVEAIHLRTVVLRDVRGAVHIYPCGSITTIANLTKDYAYAVLDVQVPLEIDADDALDLLKKIGADLATAPDWRTVVLEDVEVLGIESIGASGMTLRARLKTLPQRQWEVARELRRRLTKQFAERGIDLRVAQRMVLASRPDGATPVVTPDPSS